MTAMAERIFSKSAFKSSCYCMNFGNNLTIRVVFNRALVFIKEQSS